MKPLYTHSLLLNADANSISNDFRIRLREFIEERQLTQYNPIELQHLLFEELSLSMCMNYSDIAEDLQIKEENSKHE